MTVAMPSEQIVSLGPIARKVLILFFVDIGLNLSEGSLDLLKFVQNPLYFNFFLVHKTI